MASPLRIAYFSPLPPARSGIADYSAELLLPLGARTEVTLFVDDPDQVTGRGLPVATIDSFPERRWEFDVALYQMGNSSHHETIYRTLLRYPGVVVLHDYLLHQFMAHTTAGHQDTLAYARELGYALGHEGAVLFDDISAGRRPTPLDTLPLNDRLLDVSLATIVHSEYARHLIHEHNPAARTAVIPHLITHREGQSRRSELGLPDDTVIFGSAGQVTAARQIPLALRALRDLIDQDFPVHFLLVGEVLPEVDLERQIAALDLQPFITRIGFVPTLQAFVDWTATMDIVFNLRLPTVGETSGSALRAMDLGRPIIVYDHGWYSELPNDAVVKLPAEPDGVALAEMMVSLARDPARRAVMGSMAATYVECICNPQAVAAAYVDFLTGLREEWRHGP